MRFRPFHIVAFIWCCIIVLGVVCLIFPKKQVEIGMLKLRWLTLSEVLNGKNTPTELYLEDVDFESGDGLNPVLANDSVLQTDSILQHADTLKKNQKDSVSDTILADNKDISADTLVPAQPPLSKFIQMLSKADSMQVRVVYYGDSQIEEDRLTSVLRRHLQDEYGGGGVGLIPLHQTIPTHTLSQSVTMNGKVQTVSEGPKRYLVYGSRSLRRDTALYGVMGQVAVMDNQLCEGSENIRLFLTPRNKRKQHKEQYFTQIRLWGTDSLLFGIDGDSLTYKKTLTFRDSTTTVALRLRGKGDVYGISLETAKGVMVDNIPMRGSAGTIFTEMGSAKLKEYYSQTNTALIILQYGGNFLPSVKSESGVQSAVSGLQRQVRFLKRCAPNASILFIGPSDMLILKDGTKQTNPFVPLMDRLLRKMAAEENIGYWSLYQSMGGYNSMLGWQKKGMAGEDGIHFTRRGADQAGEMLWQWLQPQLQPLTISRPTDKHAEEQSNENIYENINDSVEQSLDTIL